MINKYGGISDAETVEPRVYSLWYGMLRRCYDEEQLSRQKGRAYQDCEVCEEWKTLSNFSRDIQHLPGYEQWLNTDGMVLDKDIFGGDSKLYCKQNCCFVPSSVNIAYMNKQNPSLVRNAQEASKAKYLLEKDGESHTFNSEKEACEFLGVKQCSVAGAWRDKGTCKGYKVTRLGNRSDMRERKDNEYDLAIEQLQHDMTFEPTFNSEDGSM